MRLRRFPSRHDATAQAFLAVAAELIDAYLHPGPMQPEKATKLRHIQFPAALEWLRTEDVIRLTATRGRHSAWRREFFSRWATRDEFLPDALVYALLREYESHDPQEYARRVPAIPETITPVSAVLIGFAEGLLAALVRHPRSYLLLHLGPLLPKHPELWNALSPGTQAAARTWLSLCEHLVTGLDLVLRPEWSTERASFVLQAMLDGFVLRHRLRPDGYPTSRWEEAGIFADAIIAFIIGAVDWDLTGQAGRTVLDTLVRP